MGNPIPGGLNDPRLGPVDHNETCPTCGLTGRMCTGHLGHVELPLPIFHPLLMDHLLLLLQSQCAHCYKLRVPEKEKRVAALMLKLFTNGSWQAAKEVESEFEVTSNIQKRVMGEAKQRKEKGGKTDAATAIFYDEADEASLSSDGDADDKEKELRDEEENESPGGSQNIDEKLSAYETQFLREKGHMHNSSNPFVLSSHEKLMRQSCIKRFLGNIAHTNKCSCCGGYSPSIRKDGFTNFFTKPLPRKWKKKNRTLGLSTFDGAVLSSSSRVVDRDMPLEDNCKSGDTRNDDND